MKYLAFTLILFSINAVAKTKDPVIATVNDEKILKSEFDKTYQQTLLFVSNKKVTKESVLNDLINRELGIQRGYSQKIDKDPVVKNKIDDIVYHAQISKDVEGKLQQIKVTDKDVENYYKTHKEYKTAHILYRLKAVPSAEDVKAAFKQSIDVYNEVKENPDKFTEMAQKLSQTNVAQSGGDLGYQPPTRYAPEYFEAIQGKPVGHITKPIRTQYGFHVIKVLGIKDYSKIDKNLYKKIIYDQKRDEIIAQYHADLRKKAKISVNLELIE